MRWRYEESLVDQAGDAGLQHAVGRAGAQCPAREGSTALTFSYSIVMGILLLNRHGILLLNCRVDHEFRVVCHAALDTGSRNILRRSACVLRCWHNSRNTPPSDGLRVPSFRNMPPDQGGIPSTGTYRISVFWVTF